MTYIITIIIGLVIYIFLNQLYKRTNHYKNIVSKQNDYLAGVPSHIRIANFGSTYSWQAFSAHKNYKISSFNFALPCESIEFDNSLLKHYFSRLAHHCIIVFHIAPCATLYRINMLNEMNMHGPRFSFFLSLPKFQNFVTLFFRKNEFQRS